MGTLINCVLTMRQLRMIQGHPVFWTLASRLSITICDTCLTICDTRNCHEFSGSLQSCIARGIVVFVRSRAADRLRTIRLLRLTVYSLLSVPSDVFHEMTAAADFPLSVFELPGEAGQCYERF